MLRRLLVLASASLLALACNSGSGSPSEPPSGSGTVITVKSDRGQVESGSPVGATLTVTAQTNGAPVANGTEVTLSTNLGNFGVDGTGKPVQLLKKTLSGGTATASFYAGSDQGTANIVAQVGTSVGRLSLPLVAPSTPPAAGFSFQTNGLTVVFTDQSTGNPTGWSWDFGDGTVSTQKSPTHIYSQAGTYTVALTATNAIGSGSKTQRVTVTATKPPVGAFCYQRNKLQVAFFDRSSQVPTRWQWDFGDCASPGSSCQSSAQNPSHTYITEDTFQVTLTVSNDGGQSTVHKSVKVSNTTVDGAPVCN